MTIQQTLIDMSAEQGWNLDSQVLILCDFIEYISTRHELQQTEEGLVTAFEAYLQNRMDEENETGQEIIPPSTFRRR